jgi:hypothetical protein
MKLALVGLLALPLAGAFAPAATRMAFTSTKLSIEVVTGREGKAATSAEEDLMLTSQILLGGAGKERTWPKLQKVRKLVVYCMSFLNNKYPSFFRKKRPKND